MNGWVKSSLADIVIDVPETATIFGNLYPNRSKIAKEIFWEIAKRHTIYMNTRDYVAYRVKTLGGKFWEYRDETATFIISTSYDYDNDFCLKRLEIAINEGCFISGTKDLIKYSLEHEIYEAWLLLNGSDKNSEFDVPHLLARKHEFRCAVADGNGLRLLKYLTLCVSNSKYYALEVDEFRYAYELALKRNPVPQTESVYI